MLDQQLCFTLYAASRLMVQAYQPFLERLGLTYPQYLVMLVLWEQDGLAVKQLGERLLLDSGTLTPLLKRLAALGHVIRQRSDVDERQVVIELTEAGRALRQQAVIMRQQMQSQFGPMLDGVDALQTPLKSFISQIRIMKTANAD